MNLIETITNELGSGTVQSLSQKLNISSDQAQSGITALIPAIFGGILKKGATMDSLGGLSSIFTGSHKPVDAAPESELEDPQALKVRGQSLVSNLFGDKLGDVSNSIGKQANLSPEQTGGLLAMAAPIVMHGITKMISEKGWSMPQFLGKLFEEKSTIEGMLPGGLASTLGLAGLSMPNVNLGGNTSPSGSVPPIDRVVPHTSLSPEPPSSSGKVLRWIIIIAVIAIVAWWLLGRNKTAPENTVMLHDTTVVGHAEELAKKAGAAVAGSLNEAGDWVYNLGANKTIKLPDGSSINVGENSSESKLVAFIEDNNQMANDTTWFSLDRLFFETGKATLKPESQEQLSNIAAIMKSFPKVKLKIGGYTDNTGSAVTNMKISGERANAAMKDLVGLGVAADRLKAEGYGPEHPIADNATAEGRAQNRRIDVRVTEK